jgi:hypothetical protein
MHFHELHGCVVPSSAGGDGAHCRTSRWEAECPVIVAVEVVDV